MTTNKCASHDDDSEATPLIAHVVYLTHVQLCQLRVASAPTLDAVRSLPLSFSMPDTESYGCVESPVTELTIDRTKENATALSAQYW
jgi:hypothetical protein